MYGSGGAPTIRQESNRPTPPRKTATQSARNNVPCCSMASGRCSGRYGGSRTPRMVMIPVEFGTSARTAVQTCSRSRLIRGRLIPTVYRHKVVSTGSSRQR